MLVNAVDSGGALDTSLNAGSANYNEYNAMPVTPI